MSTSPKLKVINGYAYANSLDVARHFQKRHDDVIRAIRSKIEAIRQVFDGDELAEHLRNFAEMSSPDYRNREQIVFNLTRDGFAFIAMSFTGREAVKWQFQYIQAFNQLEQELKAKKFHSTLDNQLKLFPDFNKDISAERPAMPIRFAYEQMIRKGIPSVTPDTIKNMVKRAELEGYKANGSWYIYDESFANYLRNRKL